MEANMGILGSAEFQAILGPHGPTLGAAGF